MSTNELSAIVVEPHVCCRGAVIWLHGLGATGDDFAPIARIANRPDLRWIFPHAPEQPVTLNGGYVMPSWYDIRTLEAGPNREDTEQLARAVAWISALIDAQVAAGLRSDQVVVAGFSQGGAVTLELALTGRHKLAGAIALSTYLVDADNAEQRRQPHNVTTPIWFGHGTLDEVVAHRRGRQAHDALAALGQPVSWRDWPMGHEVNPTEIGAVLRVIAEWLPREP